MSKEIIYGSEARKKLKEGIDYVANAVKVTLGAKGRNVIIEKSYGSPTVTNDGVSIAKEIDVSDKFANLGAQLVKEVASKTNDVAGDGTTTATLLAQALVTEGIKFIESGANPILVKKGIEFAVQKVVDELKKVSKQVEGDDIEHVASISANSTEIGKLIAEAIKKVGKDGVITVDDSKTLDTYVEFLEGMQFDRGYISPYFVTDPEKMETVYNDAYILITDKKLSDIKTLVPILEKVVQSNRPLLIIADDVEGEVLTTLIVNRLKGVLNVVAVKAPYYGEKRKEVLNDIAILTGGKVISDELGLKLENVTLNDLGQAETIKVTKDDTIIIGGKGNPDEIKKRIEQIRAQIENTTSDYEKESLQERVAKLVGGVAVIKVGASTETELKEKKYRIEDSIHATKASIEEGIIPGGGVTLIRVRKVLEPYITNPSSEFTMDEVFGMKIVYNALEYPLRQIVSNAGYDPSIVVDKVINSSEFEYGFDVMTGEYVNMYERGIIDPVKVTRSALQNASSIAGLVLTTEVLVVEEKEEKDKNK